MRIKRAILFVGLLIAATWLMQSLILGQGPVLEKGEVSNPKFTIRVERRSDLYGVMHYWYVFSSAQKGDLRWQKVTKHLLGEAVELPTKQLRFVGADVGYLFFQLKYAVTVDAGKTWSVFDFGENGSFKPELLDYSRIADVQISPDGTGHVVMFRYDMRQGQTIKFFTTDFGQHWNLTK